MPGMENLLINIKNKKDNKNNDDVGVIPYTKEKNTDSNNTYHDGQSNIPITIK